VGGEQPGQLGGAGRGDPGGRVGDPVVAQRLGGPGDLGAALLGHAGQRAQQQPGTVLEVHGKFVGRLAGPDLELDAVPPGRDRIGPRLDAEPPEPLGTHLDVGFVTVGSDPDRVHPDERGAAAVRAREDDVRADQVVTLAKHGGAHGDGFPRHRARRPLATRHHRADVGDDDSAH
jgi:hypothetical protein